MGKSKGKVAKVSIEELDEFMRYLFFKPWMSEEKWEECLELLKKKSRVTLQIIQADLQKGVDNGISVEEQLALVKRIKSMQVENSIQGQTALDILEENGIDYRDFESDL